jgi:hypothetical protein
MWDKHEQTSEIYSIQRISGLIPGSHLINLYFKVQLEKLMVDEVGYGKG